MWSQSRGTFSLSWLDLWDSPPPPLTLACPVGGLAFCGWRLRDKAPPPGHLSLQLVFVAAPSSVCSAAHRSYW